METGKILVELQDHMGSDRAIAEAAWTSSYDKNNRDTRPDDDVSRIVKMLIENKHSTPIESVVMRFWIRMPIFTDRQFQTHRIQSSSGLSGRYRTLPSDYLEFPEDCKLILQRASGRDGSIGEFMPIFDGYHEILQSSYQYYQKSLKRFRELESDGRISNSEYKRLREVIRGVLGTSFMVERTTVMNLRSFANFQKLRNSEHAQFEIQEVAVRMLERVKEARVAPIAIETLEKCKWDI